MVFFERPVDHLDLHSFPTRRSSDPESVDDAIRAGVYQALEAALRHGPEAVLDAVDRSGLRGCGGAGFPTRSGEHTFELQSRPQLLWRLPLEKKKKHVLAECN